MEYIVGWVIFAALTAAVYRYKGSPGGWLIGFLLGPLGFVLSLFLKREPHLQDRPCPYCAEPIKMSAALCKHCHQRVSPLI